MKQVLLGGEAHDEMPQDGRPCAVVDGKWVAIEMDEADGIPADLDLPGSNDEREGEGGSAEAV